MKFLRLLIEVKISQDQVEASSFTHFREDFASPPKAGAYGFHSLTKKHKNIIKASNQKKSIHLSCTSVPLFSLLYLSLLAPPAIFAIKIV